MQRGLSRKFGFPCLETTWNWKFINPVQESVSQILAMQYIDVLYSMHCTVRQGCAETEKLIRLLLIFFFFFALSSKDPEG